MALIVKNFAETKNNDRLFDSIDEDRLRKENWYFEYDAEHPDDNTIYFNSSPVAVNLSTSIKNIVIDSKPPVVVGSDIQYMVYESDYKCEITYNSDSPIDIGQLVIMNGDTKLFVAVRNPDAERITTQYIKNISIAKNGNTYKLRFTIDKSYDVDKLNADQITVYVWDTAANYAVFTTDRTWYFLKRNKNNDLITPLIIEFIDVIPKDMIIRDNVEGKTLVKITNPNVDLRSITPTVQLGDGSIGFLDVSTFTYDPATGILLFYITHINKTGNVVVQAWISMDNSETYQIIKNETYAENTLGPFIYADEGRKYKFGTYYPKYLDDENYSNFVMFTQDVLNTCHTSLETGNRIGVLEKIARIGNFNYIDKLETPLIDYYKNEYNYEVTPNLDDFLYYMYYKPEDNE